jgi:hypothetical protein
MDPQIKALVRANRMLTIWVGVLTVLLLASLAASATLVQASSDPPVRIFSSSLQDIGGGHSEGSFIGPPLAIDSSNTATVLSQVTVDLNKSGKQSCLVTGSAEVDQSVDGHSILQFTLTMDSLDGIANKPAHRRVEFQPYVYKAPAFEEVSSVAGFDNLSGTHTFYFLGRKNSDSYAPANVGAAGMVVVCYK